MSRLIELVCKFYYEDIMWVLCTHFLFNKHLEVAIISNNKFQSNSGELVNESIRFKEVLVIGKDGEQIGVKSRFDALRLAENDNLDLVCVAPNAPTPVCRIMDYGKYRFEQQKKQKEMRKNQKIIVLKECKMSPSIDIGDFNTRVNNTKKWIEHGDKVKVSVEFRGRQMAHIDIGQRVLTNFLEQVKDDVLIEKPMKLEGRSLSMILAPKKK